METCGICHPRRHQRGTEGKGLSGAPAHWSPCASKAIKDPFYLSQYSLASLPPMKNYVFRNEKSIRKRRIYNHSLKFYK